MVKRVLTPYVAAASCSNNDQLLCIMSRISLLAENLVVINDYALHV